MHFYLLTVLVVSTLLMNTIECKYQDDEDDPKDDPFSTPPPKPDSSSGPGPFAIFGIVIFVIVLVAILIACAIEINKGHQQNFDHVPIENHVNTTDHNSSMTYNVNQPPPMVSPDPVQQYQYNPPTNYQHYQNPPLVTPPKAPDETSASSEDSNPYPTSPIDTDNIAQAILPRPLDTSWDKPSPESSFLFKSTRPLDTSCFSQRKAAFQDGPKPNFMEIGSEKRTPMTTYSNPNPMVTSHDYEPLPAFVYHPIPPVAMASAKQETMRSTTIPLTSTSHVYKPRPAFKYNPIPPSAKSPGTSPSASSKSSPRKGSPSNR